jgi:epoxyqueuosine reductase
MKEKLTKEICDKAIEYGYDKCGIIPITDIEGFEEALNKRIETFPESEDELNVLKHYAHPEEEFPWAKSVIICSYSIGKFNIPQNLEGKISKSYLVDGRREKNSQQYQAHEKFQEYLNSKGLKAETGTDFDLTTMRWFAAKSGIGIIRKNNFLYTEDGSYVSLQSWLIDENLEYRVKSDLKECPEKCTRCIDMCPTKSLTNDYATNKMKCISWITCKHKNNLTEEPLHEQLGEWIYGCDVCQDVCPLNNRKWVGGEEFPGLEEFADKVSLIKIVDMSYDDLASIVQPKLWYVTTDDLWRFKVNALNSMLNNWKVEYGSIVDKACKDSNEKVRVMAEFVKSNINIGKK